jgi:uncharacterized membrane protein YadS
VAAVAFRSRGNKLRLPYFIVFFIVAMWIGSNWQQGEQLTQTIFSWSKKLMAVTLLLIGFSLSWKEMKAVGLKPVLLGVVIWALISVSSLAVILRTF